MAWTTHVNDHRTFGARGAAITPDDDTDLSEATKAIQVASIGGGAVLQILPALNADGDWITYTGVSVGFMPAFRVRRVGEATTCSVAVIED